MQEEGTFVWARGEGVLRFLWVHCFPLHSSISVRLSDVQEWILERHCRGCAEEKAGELCSHVQKFTRVP